MTEPHIYDTIIIGGGPAGLSAGIYAGRSTMDTLIIEVTKLVGKSQQPQLLQIILLLKQLMVQH